MLSKSLTPTPCVHKLLADRDLQILRTKQTGQNNMFCFVLTIYSVTLLLYRAGTTRKRDWVGGKMDFCQTHPSSFCGTRTTLQSNFIHKVFLSLADFSSKDKTHPNCLLSISAGEMCIL